MNYIDKIMAFEDGTLSINDTLELFSSLIASGEVWQLQGFYGRTAMSLIESGYIDKQGKILKREVENAE